VSQAPPDLLVRIDNLELVSQLGANMIGEFWEHILGIVGETEDIW
jgi:hypothetical protein